MILIINMNDQHNFLHVMGDLYQPNMGVLQISEHTNNNDNNLY